MKMTRISKNSSEQKHDYILPISTNKGRDNLHSSTIRWKPKWKRLILAIILFILAAQEFMPLLISSKKASKRQLRPTKIMIFNGLAFHEEVYAAFLEAFSKIERIKTSSMLLSPRWNMQEITSNLAWESSFSEETFLASRKNISLSSIPALRSTDIFLDITCGADILIYSSLYNDLFSNTTTSLYCVVHHADLLAFSTERYIALQPWAKARRLRIITLSDHVKDRLQHHWVNKRYFSDVRVEVFVPVFKAFAPRHAFGNKQSKANAPYFTIQGSIPKRNGTDALMTYEQQMAERATYGNALSAPQLLFVGNGQLEIPSRLQALVHQESMLEYSSFYTLLAGSVAIVPAIAGDQYTRDAASSTFPAAIIAGVPPVVSSDLLSAYKYLSRKAVILQTNKESAMAAAFRFLYSSTMERGKVFNEVRILRDKIIKENIDKLSEWTQSNIT